ncbi:MAG: hypothetical protein LBM93_05415 [Oscillospiraceae bacterium]|jgi:cell division protein FtsB|nr:hypothetical protein [Oscillospiraceae bacterium]
MEYLKQFFASLRKNVLIVTLILLFAGVSALLLFNISAENDVMKEQQAELNVKQQELEELQIKYEEFKSQDDDESGKYKENKAFQQGYSYPNEIRFIDKNK